MKLNLWKWIWATSLLCTAPIVVAQTFTVLSDFNGSNGAGPGGSLVQGMDGSLYGTTTWGGNTPNCGTVGCGTVFKVTRSGVLTSIYSFCPQFPCVSGSAPLGVVQGTDGNLYGTTELGGAYGNGTVFRITATGALTTLYSFCAQAGCPDGSDPFATLVQAANGDFYGTTNYGGLSNYGTVFKITREGTLTTLHSFDSTDGAYPQIALIAANDGNFYGGTYEGGDLSCSVSPLGCGTLFKISRTGTLTTVYTFHGSDGAYPTFLLQGSDGNFYGETGQGGSCTGFPSGCGTVFEITSQGALTTLHSFAYSDGANPLGLIQGTDGKFYGATQTGGANGVGTAFSITPKGSLTTLYNFCGQLNCADGHGPNPLIQDTDGRFYGTTYAGGTNPNNPKCNTDGFGTCGIVFRLSTGLHPFVAFVCNAGKAGQTAEILGQGFKGTTAVSFNGTPATFTVRSDTVLTATIPAGATSGVVTVSTPSGILTSNLRFQVIP